MMRTGPVPVSDFAATLELPGAFERYGGPGGGAVLVDVRTAPASLGPVATGRLRTLAAVVVAITDDPDTRCGWADVTLAMGDPRLDLVVERVTANPRASTVLAVLLRSTADRTVPDGLVAESTAYGLLQGGPEFARWREETPRRDRADVTAPPVLVERSGPTLVVTLNRPHLRNALDISMRDGLVDAFELAAADPSITSVELRGAGPSFCSGGDLDEFGSRPDPVTAHLVRIVRSPSRAIAEVAVRTTAYLHGHAVGSGIELAAFAGRVVADPSTRISLPELALGLIPGAGGTVSLPRRIGRQETLLLALSGAELDASTARDLGLVDEVTA